MINKERLKELINEEKMVYLVDKGFIYDIYLKEDRDNKNDITDTGLFTQWREWNKSDPLGQWFHDKYKFERLFENEDDAKEYLKYGNKTRIVKFEAPNWEELQKMVNDTKEWSVSFRIDCSHSQDLIVTVCKTIGTMDEEQPYIIRLRQLYTCEEIDFEYSREGYDKARDLCLKLFMGEEE